MLLGGIKMCIVLTQLIVNKNEQLENYKST